MSVRPLALAFACCAAWAAACLGDRSPLLGLAVVCLGVVAVVAAVVAEPDVNEDHDDPWDGLN